MNGSDTGTEAPRGSIVLRGFDAITDSATALMFIIGAVAMFVMVVTRYLFAWSDPSVEIISRYLMIWGTFVGMSAAVRFGVNIRFSMIENLLTGTAWRVFRSFGYILTFLLAIGLILSGWSLTEETMIFSERMPTSLRWPVWPFHASVFVGSILLCLQMVRAILDVWRGAEGPQTDDGLV